MEIKRKYHLLAFSIQGLCLVNFLRHPFFRPCVSSNIKFYPFGRTQNSVAVCEGLKLERSVVVEGAYWFNEVDDFEWKWVILSQGFIKAHFLYSMFQFWILFPRSILKALSSDMFLIKILRNHKRPKLAHSTTSESVETSFTWLHARTKKISLNKLSAPPHKSQNRITSRKYNKKKNRTIFVMMMILKRNFPVPFIAIFPGNSITQKDENFISTNLTKH